MLAGKLYVCALTIAIAAGVVPQLPDTSGIDFVLTDNLNVDQFFSLWLVFNNEEVNTSDEPFTIFAPINRNDSSLETLMGDPARVKSLLLDHILLGVKLNLNLSSELTFTTLGGRTVHVETANATQFANKARVLNQRVEVPHGILVILEDYLFPTDMYASKNDTTTPEQTSPEPLVKVTVEDHPADFLESVQQVLSFLKRKVKNFQQFLSKVNVSPLLKEDEEYTVFVPTDMAFQRWHPIDWGFYPFSVPEFTEYVIINHFVIGNIHQETVEDGQKAVTLGGQEIVFSTKEDGDFKQVYVNGVPAIMGDTPVNGGNMMFLEQVLFVNHSVVQKLREKNKDKETAPLLGFPWSRAQFLSHAFLALEQMPSTFTHITRFLNLADLSSYITGKGYTFFVPTDYAFEQANLADMPDNYFSKGETFQILLNHFIKGRLYENDLTEGKKLHTLGDKVIVVGRDHGNITVNGAHIVESNVFVYNLGTMFYIDNVLFVDKDNLPPVTEYSEEDTTNRWTTEVEDVENIPSELSVESGSEPDLLEEQDNDSNTAPGEKNEVSEETEEAEDLEAVDDDDEDGGSVEEPHVVTRKLTMPGFDQLNNDAVNEEEISEIREYSNKNNVPR